MNSKFSLKIKYACIASISCLLLSCDESLPPREIPPQLFSAETNAVYDYYPGKTPETYRNHIKIFVLIKNMYDETIQDTLNFFGTMRINWETQQPFDTLFSKEKTVDLNRSHIKYMKQYDPSTKIVTIDPSDSILIEYDWNFVTNDSSNLLKFFPFSLPGGEFGCKVSPKQIITISASVGLFKFRGNINPKLLNYSHCFFLNDVYPPCDDFISYPCN